MIDNQLKKTDYLFEISWEVCNKVGGIYTVVSTKAPSIVNELKDNYILIGPDVWKETIANPEFIEDKYVYKAWREQAEAEGLRIRVGRWNIASSPVAILVDFTPYFAIKDTIFTDFWLKYKVDSLSGGWDYAEPVMFGYAAAKVIESFYQFNITARDKILAQFHEWMTGSGILYLKDRLPQIGTIFTTHATALGRCIAGNKLQLYKNIAHFNPEEVARNYNLLSKFSIEKASAQIADCFTTVSEITAQECKYFLDKEPDVITVNGFDDSFVPRKEQFDEYRINARKTLIDITQALTNQKLSDNAFFIATSGRYEFSNKGIDLFIKSLGKLNQLPKLNGEVVAFLLVPANSNGVNKDLADRYGKPDYKQPVLDSYLTHYIHDWDYDSIIKSLRENGLRNRPEDWVKVVFVPVYLNGNDGLINFKYYDLLIGFDATAFPSYYEPWGYTPLESLAFHIPTITTTLAGLGLWVKAKSTNLAQGASVIERNDDNDDYVVDQMATCIYSYFSKSEEDKLIAREKAFYLSRSALWENLIDNYWKAYHQAIIKVEGRADTFKNKQIPDHIVQFRPQNLNKPSWRKIFIKSEIPESLTKLQAISKNLWWCWNNEVSELFEMIHLEMWEKVHKNPIAFLESLTYDQLVAIQHYELTKNTEFIHKLKTIYDKFDDYMSKVAEKPKECIAYFSMEFGLHDSVKIFSGGLGILAGDYLKEASDSNKNLVGIGLLYRYGYFTQKISIKGEQIAELVPQKFTHLPLVPVRDGNGDWIVISIALPGRRLFAKVWKVEVGRIPLYLLDTDIEENNEQDRTVTHQLYGGDWENRLKQEILLGIGGIRALQAMGIKPDLYHCNEGHAALINLERLAILTQEQKLSFTEASEVVRSTSLFTTHTPVPAGHDSFTEDMMRIYLSHYAERLKISWDTLMNLGRATENDPNERFSMSVFAAKLSQEMNGVSKIHRDVSRKMFNAIWDGYYPQELHVDSVTNGVHYYTWTAKRWQNLYKNEFGANFLSDQSNQDYWRKIQQVSDYAIWEIRQKQRKELIDFMKIKINEDLTKREENPKLIFQIIESFNEYALTIGFARRFATYKRAHLLFKNENKLAELVNNKQHPVQFVFAGKAHPADKAGQDLIKHIIQISKTKEFIGKITFLENYDMEIAKKLVQGVDIWLNTPTRPLEASGTSGEKAALNGVLNLSVLDGWWAEGYRPHAGWALKQERTYEQQQMQDELDSEIIYNLLEDEIIPLFYDRDGSGIPSKWISYIKNDIAEIAPRFTMKRMLDDYQNIFYTKMYKRSQILIQNDFEVARKLADWKKKIIRAWESLEVLDIKVHDSRTKPLTLGEKFKAEIIINLHEINPNDVGVEVVFGQKEMDEVKEIIDKQELKIVKIDKSVVTYSCEIFATRSGVFDFAFRIFPKHELLPNRQDFPLLKWIS